MTLLQLSQMNSKQQGYDKNLAKIIDGERRKTTQYIGEGSIFFLFIVAGGVYLFRMARKQLRQSQEQQHFMMAITHELKTPIAISKLNLETLQKRKLDESQQQRLIQNTIQEANRLNSLCNNLLLSYQMEAGGYKMTLEAINFTDLVNECIQDFIIRFPQRTIITDIEKNIFAKGDPFLLKIAINNLIDNAIKYSPKHSETHLSLLDRKSDQFQLMVKDEGLGIPAEEKQNIFKKFYRIGNTATKESKGTGIGLYLTGKIIKQHKGTIIVNDNIPSGSVFIIELKKHHN